MGVIAYSFAGDRLAIHVSGRRGQGIPVSSFIIGDESCHSAIDLLIGKEDSFDSTDLWITGDLKLTRGNSSTSKEKSVSEVTVGSVSYSVICA